MLIINLSIYLVMGLLFWWGLRLLGKRTWLSLIIIITWPIYLIIFAVSIIRKLRILSK